MTWTLKIFEMNGNGSCEFLKLFEDLVLWEGPLQELCGIGKRTWITVLSSTRNVPVPNCKQCEDTKGQWFWCWKAWGRNQARDYTTLVLTWGNDGPEPPGLWIGAWRPIWRRKSARWIACETGNHLGLAYIHSTEPVVFIRWRTKKSGHVDSTGLVDEFKCVLQFLNAEAERVLGSYIQNSSRSIPEASITYWCI